MFWSDNFEKIAFCPICMIMSSLHDPGTPTAVANTEPIAATMLGILY